MRANANYVSMMEFDFEFESGVQITESHPVWARLWGTLRERGNVSGYRLLDGAFFVKVATEVSTKNLIIYNLNKY